MGRLSKCKRCTCTLEPDKKVLYNGKNYCCACYEIVKQESTEYKELMTFICDNFGISEPTGLILSQIKNYKTTNNYNYAAMTYTLWYCKDILGKSLDVKYGVSLIPYFYDEAKDYYIQQQNIIDSISKYKDVDLKVKVVKQNHSNNEKSNSLIDLESLLKGVDND